MDTIVLDPGVKETLLSDAREFTQTRQWYVDRGRCTHSFQLDGKPNHITLKLRNSISEGISAGRYSTNERLISVVIFFSSMALPGRVKLPSFKA